MFNCPKCSFETLSAKGWKQHLSKTHNGWTDEMWAEAAAKGSVQPGAVATGFKDLFEAAAAAPETDQPVETQAAEPGKRTPRRTPLDKEMAMRVEEMRSKFFEALAKWMSDFIENTLPGEKVSEKDKKFLHEGLEFPAKCLNVEFAIEPLNWQLTSMVWVLIMPVIALLAVMIPRIKLHGPKDKQDRGDDSTERDGQDLSGIEIDEGT